MEPETSGWKSPKTGSGQTLLQLGKVEYMKALGLAHPLKDEAIFHGASALEKSRRRNGRLAHVEMG